MRYEFDGYSEASSSPGRVAANTRNHGPGTAGQDRDRDREERRENADGFYRGTGRFARENRESDAARDGTQNRPRHASPYHAAFYDYVGLRGPRRSEEEWSRIFAETYRRAAEERGGDRGRRGAAANGAGTGSAGYGDRHREDGGYDQQSYGAAQSMSYEEFLSGLFGGGGISGGGFEGGRNGPTSHGPDTAGYGSREGSFGPTGGFGGVRFEDVFGSPGYYDGGQGDGAYGGGREGRTEAGPRRGGAGMTREEFDNLFRARFEGPSPTGYGGGGPPADLFDRWHSDW